jgi:hypothetical protein
MNQSKFRPTVERLDDRQVPSVSPAQVVAAYTDTEQTAQELEKFASTVGEPRTTAEISYIASQYPLISTQSQSDEAVLSEFAGDYKAALAQNPSLVPYYGKFAGGIGYAVYQALLNADYAEVYAIGFGATPPPPPASPPPPPGDTGVNLGGSVPLPAGTSDSNPAGSTLPFSLGDPNWQNLSNGVRIWDVTVGSGTPVAAGDSVTLNYIGYLTSGTIFDSNTSTTSPFQTTLSTSSVIPGFVDGIAGMQPGGVRRIDIPASLAYGSAGKGSVPANAELVFQITLISSP